MDTIFALSSARGKAGVAVIRVSGPLAWDSIEKLAGPLPQPRRMALRRVCGVSGEAIDDALIVCFPKGSSFTGENVAEFHVHGSVAVISALLRELGGISGVKMAEPGEFTRQALENGCLDLSQVEGLGDLIDAETESQRRQAKRVFDGALGALAEEWRRELIAALALLEVSIDFSDEEIPADVVPMVLDRLEKALASLTAESRGSVLSERIRDGFEVAIVGPTNVGKSTLLNRLAGRDAAITSEIAGTTRDVIEVRMDLRGLPVTVLDTAGIRDTSDRVELIGVDRAVMRANNADIRVFLLDDVTNGFGSIPSKDDDIFVRGKADKRINNKGLTISGQTGQGVSELVELLASRLEKLASGAGVATNARHRTAIDLAINHLEMAKTIVEERSDRVEIAAADMHHALNALESLIGAVDVENVLDEIFARFCLGK